MQSIIPYGQTDYNNLYDVAYSTYNNKYIQTDLIGHFTVYLVDNYGANAVLSLAGGYELRFKNGVLYLFDNVGLSKGPIYKADVFNFTLSLLNLSGNGKFEAGAINDIKHTLYDETTLMLDGKATYAEICEIVDYNIYNGNLITLNEKALDSAYSYTSLKQLSIAKNKYGEDGMNINVTSSAPMATILPNALCPIDTIIIPESIAKYVNVPISISDVLSDKSVSKLVTNVSFNEKELRKVISNIEATGNKEIVNYLNDIASKNKIVVDKKRYIRMGVKDFSVEIIGGKTKISMDNISFELEGTTPRKLFGVLQRRIVSNENVIFMRYPVLFGGGFSLKKVVINRDPTQPTIFMNPYTVAPFGADFDGDALRMLFAPNSFDTSDKLQHIHVFEKNNNGNYVVKQVPLEEAKMKYLSHEYNYAASYKILQQSNLIYKELGRCSDSILEKMKDNILFDKSTFSNFENNVMTLHSGLLKLTNSNSKTINKNLKEVIAKIHKNIHELEILTGKTNNSKLRANYGDIITMNETFVSMLENINVDKYSASEKIIYVKQFSNTDKFSSLLDMHLKELNEIKKYVELEDKKSQIIQNLEKTNPMFVTNTTMIQFLHDKTYVKLHKKYLLDHISGADKQLVENVLKIAKTKTRKEFEASISNDLPKLRKIFTSVFTNNISNIDFFTIEDSFDNITKYNVSKLVNDFIFNVRETGSIDLHNNFNMKFIDIFTKSFEKTISKNVKRIAYNFEGLESYKIVKHNFKKSETELHNIYLEFFTKLKKELESEDNIRLAQTNPTELYKDVILGFIENYNINNVSSRIIEDNFKKSLTGVFSKYYLHSLGILTDMIGQQVAATTDQRSQFLPTVSFFDDIKVSDMNLGKMERLMNGKSSISKLNKFYAKNEYLNMNLKQLEESLTDYITATTIFTLDDNITVDELYSKLDTKLSKETLRDIKNIANGYRRDLNVSKGQVIVKFEDAVQKIASRDVTNLGKLIFGVYEDVVNYGDELYVDYFDKKTQKSTRVYFSNIIEKDHAFKQLKFGLRGKSGPFVHMVASSVINARTGLAIGANFRVLDPTVFNFLTNESKKKAYNKLDIAEFKKGINQMYGVSNKSMFNADLWHTISIAIAGGDGLILRGAAVEIPGFLAKVYDAMLTLKVGDNLDKNYNKSMGKSKAYLESLIGFGAASKDQNGDIILNRKYLDPLLKDITGYLCELPKYSKYFDRSKKGYVVKSESVIDFIKTIYNDATDDKFINSLVERSVPKIMKEIESDKGKIVNNKLDDIISQTVFYKDIKDKKTMTFSIIRYDKKLDVSSFDENMDKLYGSKTIQIKDVGTLHNEKRQFVEISKVSDLTSTEKLKNILKTKLNIPINDNEIPILLESNNAIVIVETDGRTESIGDVTRHSRTNNLNKNKYYDLRVPMINITGIRTNEKYTQTTLYGLFMNFMHEVYEESTKALLKEVDGKLLGDETEVKSYEIVEKIFNKILLSKKYEEFKSMVDLELTATHVATVKMSKNLILDLLNDPRLQKGAVPLVPALYGGTVSDIISCLSQSRAELANKQTGNVASYIGTFIEDYNQFLTTGMNKRPNVFGKSDLGATAGANVAFYDMSSNTIEDAVVQLNSQNNFSDVKRTTLKELLKDGHVAYSNNVTELKFAEIAKNHNININGVGGLSPQIEFTGVSQIFVREKNSEGTLYDINDSKVKKYINNGNVSLSSILTDKNVQVLPIFKIGSKIIYKNENLKPIELTTFNKTTAGLLLNVSFSDSSIGIHTIKPFMASSSSKVSTMGNKGVAALITSMVNVFNVPENMTDSVLEELKANLHQGREHLFEAKYTAIEKDEKSGKYKTVTKTAPIDYMFGAEIFNTRMEGATETSLILSNFASIFNESGLDINVHIEFDDMSYNIVVKNANNHRKIYSGSVNGVKGFLQEFGIISNVLTGGYKLSKNNKKLKELLDFLCLDKDGKTIQKDLVIAFTGMIESLFVENNGSYEAIVTNNKTTLSHKMMLGMNMPIKLLKQFGFNKHVTDSSDGSTGSARQQTMQTIIEQGVQTLYNTNTKQIGIYYYKNDKGQYKIVNINTNGGFRKDFDYYIFNGNPKDAVKLDFKVVNIQTFHMPWIKQFNNLINGSSSLTQDINNRTLVVNPKNINGKSVYKTYEINLSSDEINEKILMSPEIQQKIGETATQLTMKVFHMNAIPGKAASPAAMELLFSRNESLLDVESGKVYQNINELDDRVQVVEETSDDGTSKLLEKRHISKKGKLLEYIDSIVELGLLHDTYYKNGDFLGDLETLIQNEKYEIPYLFNMKGQKNLIENAMYKVFENLTSTERKDFTDRFLTAYDNYGKPGNNVLLLNDTIKTKLAYLLISPMYYGTGIFDKDNKNHREAISNAITLLAETFNISFKLDENGNVKSLAIISNLKNAMSNIAIGSGALLNRDIHLLNPIRFNLLTQIYKEDDINSPFHNKTPFEVISEKFETNNKYGIKEIANKINETKQVMEKLEGYLFKMTGDNIDLDKKIGLPFENWIDSATERIKDLDSRNDSFNVKREARSYINGMMKELIGQMTYSNRPGELSSVLKYLSDHSSELSSKEGVSDSQKVFLNTINETMNLVRDVVNNSNATTSPEAQSAGLALTALKNRNPQLASLLGSFVGSNVSMPFAMKMDINFDKSIINGFNKEMLSKFATNADKQYNMLMQTNQKNMVPYWMRYNYSVNTNMSKSLRNATMSQFYKQGLFDVDNLSGFDNIHNIPMAYNKQPVTKYDYMKAVLANERKNLSFTTEKTFTQTDLLNNRGFVNIYKAVMDLSKSFGGLGVSTDDLLKKFNVNVGLYGKSAEVFKDQISVMDRTASALGVSLKYNTTETVARQLMKNNDVVGVQYGYGSNKKYYTDIGYDKESRTYYGRYTGKDGKHGKTMFTDLSNATMVVEDKNGNNLYVDVNENIKGASEKLSTHPPTLGNESNKIFTISNDIKRELYNNVKMYNRKNTELENGTLIGVTIDQIQRQWVKDGTDLARHTKINPFLNNKQTIVENMSKNKLKTLYLMANYIEKDMNETFDKMGIGKGKQTTIDGSTNISSIAESLTSNEKEFIKSPTRDVFNRVLNTLVSDTKDDTHVLSAYHNSIDKFLFKRNFNDNYELSDDEISTLTQEIFGQNTSINSKDLYKFMKGGTAQDIEDGKDVDTRLMGLLNTLEYTTLTDKTFNKIIGITEMDKLLGGKSLKSNATNNKKHWNQVRADLIKYNNLATLATNQNYPTLMTSDAEINEVIDDIILSNKNGNLNLDKNVMKDKLNKLITYATISPNKKNFIEAIDLGLNNVGNNIGSNRDSKGNIDLSNFDKNSRSLYKYLTTNSTVNDIYSEFTSNAFGGAVLPEQLMKGTVAKDILETMTKSRFIQASDVSSIERGYSAINDFLLLNNNDFDVMKNDTFNRYLKDNALRLSDKYVPNNEERLQQVSGAISLLSGDLNNDDNVTKNLLKMIVQNNGNLDEYNAGINLAGNSKMTEKLVMSSALNIASDFFNSGYDKSLIDIGITRNSEGKLRSDNVGDNQSLDALQVILDYSNDYYDSLLKNQDVMKQAAISDIYNLSDDGIDTSKLPDEIVGKNRAFINGINDLVSEVKGKIIGKAFNDIDITEIKDVLDRNLDLLGENISAADMSKYEKEFGSELNNINSIKSKLTTLHRFITFDSEGIETLRATNYSNAMASRYGTNLFNLFELNPLVNSVMAASNVGGLYDDVNLMYLQGLQKDKGLSNRNRIARFADPNTTKSSLSDVINSMNPYEFVNGADNENYDKYSNKLQQVNTLLDNETIDSIIGFATNSLNDKLLVNKGTTKETTLNQAIESVSREVASLLFGNDSLLQEDNFGKMQSNITGKEIVDDKLRNVVDKFNNGGNQVFDDPIMASLSKYLSVVMTELAVGNLVGDDQSLGNGAVKLKLSELNNGEISERTIEEFATSVASPNIDAIKKEMKVTRTLDNTFEYVVDALNGETLPSFLQLKNNYTGKIQKDLGTESFNLSVLPDQLLRKYYNDVLISKMKYEPNDAKTRIFSDTHIRNEAIDKSKLLESSIGKVMDEISLYSQDKSIVGVGDIFDDKKVDLGAVNYGIMSKYDGKKSEFDKIQKELDDKKSNNKISVDEYNKKNNELKEAMDRSLKDVVLLGGNHDNMGNIIAYAATIIDEDTNMIKVMAHKTSEGKDGKDTVFKQAYDELKANSEGLRKLDSNGNEIGYSIVDDINNAHSVKTQVSFGTGGHGVSKQVRGKIGNVAIKRKDSDKIEIVSYDEYKKLLSNEYGSIMSDDIAKVGGTELEDINKTREDILSTHKRQIAIASFKNIMTGKERVLTSKLTSSDKLLEDEILSKTGLYDSPYAVAGLETLLGAHGRNNGKRLANRETIYGLTSMLSVFDNVNRLGTGKITKDNYDDFTEAFLLKLASISEIKDEKYRKASDVEKREMGDKYRELDSNDVNDALFGKEGIFTGNGLMKAQYDVGVVKALFDSEMQKNKKLFSIYDKGNNVLIPYSDRQNTMVLNRMNGMKDIIESGHKVFKAYNLDQKSTDNMLQYLFDNIYSMRKLGDKELTTEATSRIDSVPYGSSEARLVGGLALGKKIRTGLNRTVPATDVESLTINKYVMESLYGKELESGDKSKINQTVRKFTEQILDKSFESARITLESINDDDYSGTGRDVKDKMRTVYDMLTNKTPKEKNIGNTASIVDLASEKGSMLSNDPMKIAEFKMMLGSIAALESKTPYQVAKEANLTDSFINEHIGGEDGDYIPLMFGSNAVRMSSRMLTNTDWGYASSLSFEQVQRKMESLNRLKQYKMLSASDDMVRKMFPMGALPAYLQKFTSTKIRKDIENTEQYALNEHIAEAMRELNFNGYKNMDEAFDLAIGSRSRIRIDENGNENETDLMAVRGNIPPAKYSTLTSKEEVPLLKGLVNDMLQKELWLPVTNKILSDDGDVDKLKKMKSGQYHDISLDYIDKSGSARVDAIKRSATYSVYDRLSKGKDFSNALVTKFDSEKDMYSKLGMVLSGSKGTNMENEVRGKIAEYIRNGDGSSAGFKLTGKEIDKLEDDQILNNAELLEKLFTSGENNQTLQDSFANFMDGLISGSMSKIVDPNAKFFEEILSDLESDNPERRAMAEKIDMKLYEGSREAAGTTLDRSRTGLFSEMRRIIKEEKEANAGNGPIFQNVRGVVGATDKISQMIAQKALQTSNMLIGPLMGALGMMWSWQTVSSIKGMGARKEGNMAGNLLSKYNLAYDGFGMNGLDYARAAGYTSALSIYDNNSKYLTKPDERIWASYMTMNPEDEADILKTYLKNSGDYTTMSSSSNIMSELMSYGLSEDAAKYNVATYAGSKIKTDLEQHYGLESTALSTPLDAIKVYTGRMVSFLSLIYDVLAGLGGFFGVAHIENSALVKYYNDINNLDSGNVTDGIVNLLSDDVETVNTATALKTYSKEYKENSGSIASIIAENSEAKDNADVSTNSLQDRDSIFGLNQNIQQLNAGLVGGYMMQMVEAIISVGTLLMAGISLGTSVFEKFTNISTESGRTLRDISVDVETIKHNFNNHFGLNDSSTSGLLIPEIKEGEKSLYGKGRDYIFGNEQSSKPSLVKRVKNNLMKAGSSTLGAAVIIGGDGLLQDSNLVYPDDPNVSKQTVQGILENGKGWVLKEMSDVSHVPMVISTDLTEPVNIIDTDKDGNPIDKKIALGLNKRGVKAVNATAAIHEKVIKDMSKMKEDVLLKAFSDDLDKQISSGKLNYEATNNKKIVTGQLINDINELAKAKGIDTGSLAYNQSVQKLFDKHGFVYENKKVINDVKKEVNKVQDSPIAKAQNVINASSVDAKERYNKVNKKVDNKTAQHINKIANSVLGKEVKYSNIPGVELTEEDIANYVKSKTNTPGKKDTVLENIVKEKQEYSSVAAKERYNKVIEEYSEYNAYAKEFDKYGLSYDEVNDMYVEGLDYKKPEDVKKFAEMKKANPSNYRDPNLTKINNPEYFKYQNDIEKEYEMQKKGELRRLNKEKNNKYFENLHKSISNDIPSTFLLDNIVDDSMLDKSSGNKKVKKAVDDTEAKFNKLSEALGKMDENTGKNIKSMKEFANGKYGEEYKEKAINALNQPFEEFSKKVGKQSLSRDELVRMQKYSTEIVKSFDKLPEGIKYNTEMAADIKKEINRLYEVEAKQTTGKAIKRLTNAAAYGALGMTSYAADTISGGAISNIAPDFYKYLTGFESFSMAASMTGAKNPLMWGVAGLFGASALPRVIQGYQDGNYLEAGVGALSGSLGLYGAMKGNTKAMLAATGLEILQQFWNQSESDDNTEDANPTSIKIWNAGAVADDYYDFQRDSDGNKTTSSMPWLTDPINNITESHPYASQMASYTGALVGSQILGNAMLHPKDTYNNIKDRLKKIKDWKIKTPVSPDAVDDVAKIGKVEKVKKEVDVAAKIMNDPKRMKAVNKSVNAFLGGTKGTASMGTLLKAGGRVIQIGGIVAGANEIWNGKSGSGIMTMAGLTSLPGFAATIGTRLAYNPISNLLGGRKDANYDEDTNLFFNDMFSGQMTKFSDMKLQEAKANKDLLGLAMWSGYKDIGQRGEVLGMLGHGAKEFIQDPSGSVNNVKDFIGTGISSMMNNVSNIDIDKIANSITTSINSLTDKYENVKKDHKTIQMLEKIVMALLPIAAMQKGIVAIEEVVERIARIFGSHTEFVQTNTNTE